ncbi:MAG: hypothetical protein JWN08_2233 [Frankiales bacterium]|nr:hypothetical protein [Frankiales bacterium]
MDERWHLRRHLYEQLARTCLGRRALRRQIALVTATGSPGGPDDGSAGVREPRRPHPASSPAAARRD